MDFDHSSHQSDFSQASVISLGPSLHSIQTPEGDDETAPLLVNDIASSRPEQRQGSLLWRPLSLLLTTLYSAPSIFCLRRFTWKLLNFWRWQTWNTVVLFCIKDCCIVVLYCIINSCIVSYKVIMYDRFLPIVLGLAINMPITWVDQRGDWWKRSFTLKDCFSLFPFYPLLLLCLFRLSKRFAFSWSYLFTLIRCLEPGIGDAMTIVVSLCRHFHKW